MNEVLGFYKSILEAAGSLLVRQLAEFTIKLAAFEFLLSSLGETVRPYLITQSWDRLVLGVHAKDHQICPQCFQVKPYGDYLRLLDLRNKCGDCRGANERRRKRVAQHWKEEQRRVEGLREKLFSEFRQHRTILGEPAEGERASLEGDLEQRLDQVPAGHTPRESRPAPGTRI
jgi:hypothetical protein